MTSAASFASSLSSRRVLRESSDTTLRLLKTAATDSIESRIPRPGFNNYCAFLLLLCALRDVPAHVFVGVIRIFGELAAQRFRRQMIGVSSFNEIVFHAMLNALDLPRRPTLRRRSPSSTTWR